jgi:uncharacterized protein
MQPGPGDIEISIRGETLVMMPERALYWPRTRTLFITDPHFGKTETFHAHGIPLPQGTLASDLDRLSQALTRSGADKIIVLGDLLHAREAHDPAVIVQVSAWRGHHRAVKMILVRGNHDKRAGDPPAEWHIETIDGPTPGPLFALAHKPMQIEGAYVLCGHLHPAVALEGRGQQRLKQPCFWFTEHYGVLPAFGEFTGTSLIVRQPKDRVFVLAPQRIFALP